MEPESEEQSERGWWSPNGSIYCTSPSRSDVQVPFCSCYGYRMGLPVLFSFGLKEGTDFIYWNISYYLGDKGFHEGKVNHHDIWSLPTISFNTLLPFSYRVQQAFANLYQFLFLTSKRPKQAFTGNCRNFNLKDANIDHSVSSFNPVVIKLFTDRIPSA